MLSEQIDKNYIATILIVDDNPNNLNPLFSYLLESGFKTLVAENGEEAIQHAQTVQPDIILMDVMMPGIDGFETCRLLKQNNKTCHIPVIFITALYESVDIERGFKVGGMDYITKPFKQEEVLARINKEIIIAKQKNELIQLNKKLKLLNTQLEESNAKKNRFFSIISHDMRDVFNGLLGFSEIIAKSDSNIDIEYLQIFAQHMHTSVQNAFHLLENLLYWTNIEMNTMNFDPQKIDIYEIIPEDIAEYDLNKKQVNNKNTCSDNYGIVPQNMRLLYKYAVKKKITIYNYIEKNTLVFADTFMLSTIFCNLISNAIKFTNSSGYVKLFAEKKNDFVEICIMDNGTGIKNDNLKRLFKIEQKFKKNGTQGELGSGLGLILCKVLVEKNNGKIWVESNEGNGSKFFFILPVP